MLDNWFRQILFPKQEASQKVIPTAKRPIQKSVTELSIAQILEAIEATYPHQRDDPGAYVLHLGKCKKKRSLGQLEHSRTQYVDRYTFGIFNNNEF